VFATPQLQLLFTSVTASVHHAGTGTFMHPQKSRNRKQKVVESASEGGVSGAGGPAARVAQLTGECPRHRHHWQTHAATTHISPADVDGIRRSEQTKLCPPCAADAMAAARASSLPVQPTPASIPQAAGASQPGAQADASGSTAAPAQFGFKAYWAPSQHVSAEDQRRILRTLRNNASKAQPAERKIRNAQTYMINTPEGIRPVKITLLDGTVVWPSRCVLHSGDFAED
jgi:hypothetical protein